MSAGTGRARVAYIFLFFWLDDAVETCFVEGMSRNGGQMLISLLVTGVRAVHTLALRLLSMILEFLGKKS